MHQKRRQNNMGGGSGGQHRHHNNRPRRFNNNGRSQGEGGGGDAASISRTRRHATQSREKYQMMARDAMAQGDRVLAENWLQHADHYHRVLLSLPPEEAPRPQYLPGHQPGGDQQQGSNTQQHNDGEAQQTDNNDMQASNALPSFITQPLNPENPEDR